MYITCCEPGDSALYCASLGRIQLEAYFAMRAEQTAEIRGINLFAYADELSAATAQISQAGDELSVDLYADGGCKHWTMRLTEASLSWANYFWEWLVALGKSNRNLF